MGEKEISMYLKNWALGILLLATPAIATPKPCAAGGGDCQQGTIAGPYTSAQVAEHSTTAPFPICQSGSCTSGSWNGFAIEGIDAVQNTGTAYQFYGSQGPNIDPNIAVGPTVSGRNGQVLQWVNAEYLQAFDKVTGQPIFTKAGGTTAVPVNVAALWSSSTQPECYSNLSGNVQVIFDRIDNAFVISRRVVYTSASQHLSAWCIAASSGSDLSSPSIQWYAYEYRMNTAIPCTPASNNCTTGAYQHYFPDWPRIGTWSNGFYITFDLQDPNSAYVESGIEACQLDRTDIVHGNPTNPMTCYAYTVPVAQRPSLIHSVDVADIDSAAGPTSGEPEYFLSIVNPSNALQGGAGQSFCTSKTTPCTSNQLALFTWGSAGLTGPTAVNVSPYTPGCYNTSAANQEANTYCVPEPSTNTATIGAYGKPSCGNYTTPCLDSLGDRMANRLTYNHLTSTTGGPNGEFLTASHVVMESTNNQRTGIRYYVLSVSSGKASVLVDSGSASGPPDLQDPNGIQFFLMPSAALDQNGNLGMTFTSSGTAGPPAVWFDVLPLNASAFDLATLIVQGTGDQDNTDRFGEYAATVIDSSDNLTFYGIGEYYDTNQTGTTNCGLPASGCYTWQTRIFRGQYGQF
jgi:hypothetical protein